MRKQILKISNFLFRQHLRKTLLVLSLLLLAYWFCLPKPLFKVPYSLVLEDRSGELLGARIAADGQWRFPQNDSLPEKFIASIIEFEDKRFFSHPGIDAIGLVRAMRQNLQAGEIVSGGSTITMQTMRLARNAGSRSLYQKIVEMIMATRLELTYSKNEILSLYAAHAPFGGNVVGLEAASWRYFSKSPHLLSWAEAAMLAVLPNSPGLIHPGRNRDALMAKRNRLLDRLLMEGVLDSLSCELAKSEALPEKPHPLPRLAPYLLDRAYLDKKLQNNAQQARLKTSVDKALQQQLTELMQRQQGLLARKQIHNLAAIIIEVETGEILAYGGNVRGAGEAHGEQVDIIPARRSTGSLLKPILYALLLQEGQLLPNTFVPDIPSQMGGYRPENFNKEYDGVVTVQKALIRSLNVPFVHLLQQYGLEKFHHELKQMGFQMIDQAPDHYGLPLILGGAESSLLEITSAYASMARTLGHFNNWDGEYAQNDFHNASYIRNEHVEKPKSLLQHPPRLSASAIWFAFDAMKNLERPNSEGEWEYFQSSQSIAWKTGTSFGFRDAWAIGVNPRYVVGVWAGNADGEGRPGLVGVQAAAPLLFDIFNRLPSSEWFYPPYDEMIELPVCKNSGFRKGPHCPADTIGVPTSGTEVKVCPYHFLIHLDSSLSWQVNSDCETPDQIQHQPWFILPPAEAYYYKNKDPGYQDPPRWRNDCKARKNDVAGSDMQLIYPKYPTRIYVPVDLNGQRSKTVFQLAHRNPDATVHWHLDETFLGTTHTFHTFELDADIGPHLLTLVDENGNRLEQKFEIIGKDN